MNSLSSNEMIPPWAESDQQNIYLRFPALKVPQLIVNFLLPIKAHTLTFALPEAVNHCYTSCSAMIGICHNALFEESL